MTSWKKPLPTITGETLPFWDACRRGTLLLQRCGRCQEFQFYPRGICANCWCTDINWVDASGRGTVWTFTVTRLNRDPGFIRRRPLRPGPGGVGRRREAVHQYRRVRPR